MTDKQTGDQTTERVALDLREDNTKHIDRLVARRAELANDLVILDSDAFTSLLDEFQAIPSLIDVKEMRATVGQHNPDKCYAYLTFTLHDDRLDSSFPRDIVARGICRHFYKSPNYKNEFLELSGITTRPGLTTVHIAIEGYRPQTCHVEYDDILVPEHVERKARIVCEPNHNEVNES